MRKVIVWFRQDLRIHDNEALSEALAVADQVIPVYVFDPRFFRATTEFGFPKITPARARFIIESVNDLRLTIRELGSELVVRVGHAEDELFELARSVKSNWIFCNRERTAEEAAIQDELEQRLWTVGQEMRYSRGKMLYYTADLPFPVTHTPDSFTTFRKETERFIDIREPLPTPARIPGYTADIVPGRIPDLADLGVEDSQFGCKPSTIGGEREAIVQVDRLIERLCTDDSPLDDLSEGPFASPWLAQGCLSPKYLYHRLISQVGKQDERLSDMITGLYYRDYLRLMVKKHGHLIFEPGGITGEDVVEKGADLDRLRIWTNAVTGIPIIDASIRQLTITGYLPGRLRSITALFLIRELEVPWRYGASFFESNLVDYDPCSNWTNWCNVAGYGPDTREVKATNYILQARKFDPDGSYVKRWLPELSEVSSQLVHQPDQADPVELSAHGVVLGKDYPKSVYPTDRWHTIA